MQIGDHLVAIIHLLISMIKPPVVLLYGLDEASQPFEVEATNALVIARRKRCARAAGGWRSCNWRTTWSPRSSRSIARMDRAQPVRRGAHAGLLLCSRAHVLEALDYTFTGSDYRCLDQTQFKTQMKRLLGDHHVPTPAWSVVHSAEDVAFDVFPAIVKPASEHCSMGSRATPSC